MMVLTEAVITEWSNQLKTLLETKHLYQSVDAQVVAVRAKETNKILAGAMPHIDVAINSWESRPLEAVMVRGQQAVSSLGGSQAAHVKHIMLVTNMKLFCTFCKNSEVFYPVWARDVAPECRDPRGNTMPRKNFHQLFFIAFQCQNCHSDPEGFVVRRSAYKLTLEGRSPMEGVQLAKYLPRTEARFISDAMVAFNPGKKLAGLFYLRTFLEQYARRLTGVTGRVTGEALMDAYMEQLPTKHRDSMPSFRSLYERLSEALHEAREDDALFQAVNEDIDLHFDIRRVFKIPEIPLGALKKEEAEPAR